MAGDNLRFTVDGQRYEWSGGYGAVIKSYEWGVRRGDVRCILGRLFHAYLVYPSRLFAPREVCWSFIGDALSNEAIRAFRAEVFGCE